MACFNSPDKQIGVNTCCRLICYRMQINRRGEAFPHAIVVRIDRESFCGIVGIRAVDCYLVLGAGYGSAIA